MTGRAQATELVRDKGSLESIIADHKRASCLRRKIFSALRAALERVPNSRNCRASWARSRSIETKRSRECAVLMELGACHECASRSNLAFRVDFCSQIHRVRIFCGGQADLCRAVNRVRGRCACKDEVLARAKGADDPPEEMPERHNHGKNCI